MSYEELLTSLKDLIDRIPPGDWPENMAIHHNDRDVLTMARQLLITRENIIRDMERVESDLHKRIDDQHEVIQKLLRENQELREKRAELSEIHDAINNAQYAVKIAHDAALDEYAVYSIAEYALRDMHSQFAYDRSDIPF